MNYKTVEGELGVAVFELIIFSGVHFQTLVALHPPRLYSPNGSTQAFPYLSLAQAYGKNLSRPRTKVV